jgi:VIT1/CCC1 family predicted Fe2+/Mn2+ transporter
MADGLTVPFALAAGLSGASLHNSTILTAGLAEIVAGSIAMGLGGYLAGKTEVEHYQGELKREHYEVEVFPELERKEVEEIFKGYGISSSTQKAFVDELSQNKDKWVDFMMRFELGLERPDPSRAWKSAATIASAYVIGGLIPLSAYFFVEDAHRALLYSAAVTMVALAVFGGVKGRFTGVPVLKSGMQTVLIGGLAAAAAFFIARWIG